LYSQCYDQFSKRPALLSVVGFTGHGKTVYLASLMHALEKSLIRLWPSPFYRMGLDQNTVDTVIQNSMLLTRGELPQSTPKTFPRPSIHLLNQIPQYGTRGLIVYDPSGESFNSGQDIMDFAGFVQRARVVMFLVSIADLEEPKADHLFRLLNNYVLGMANMKGKTRDQHLVVTFTKADQLLESLAPYPLVVRHLISDSNELASPKKYTATMTTISNVLSDYMRMELQAINFMRLAQTQFKSVVYCAVSALGAAPEQNRLLTAVEPRCVVDPFLWVLEKS
jgi:hypothetical protein